MLFGQDQVKLDSLNGLLESAEHDTTRAKLLKKIGINNPFSLSHKYNQSRIAFGLFYNQFML
jgi:hypothetical protein